MSLSLTAWIEELIVFILSLMNNLIFVKSLKPSVVIEFFMSGTAGRFSRPPEEETFAFDLIVRCLKYLSPG